MGQLEDLLGRQQQVANNIEKSCNDGFDLNQELEKARSGIYADNAENRRLHRVGQKYGSDKKPEEQGNERQPKQDEENSGYQKMASQASDGALKRAAADEEADPKVREMAKQELKKRGGGKEEKDGEKENKKKGMKDYDSRGEEVEEHIKKYTANKKLEKIVREIADAYDNAWDDEGENFDDEAALKADEKFFNEMAPLVAEGSVNFDDLHNMKKKIGADGIDFDWDEIEKRATQYQQKQIKKEDKSGEKDLNNKTGKALVQSIINLKNDIKDAVEESEKKDLKTKLKNVQQKLETEIGEVLETEMEFTDNDSEDFRESLYNTYDSYKDAISKKKFFDIAGKYMDGEERNYAKIFFNLKEKGISSKIADKYISTYKGAFDKLFYKDGKNIREAKYLADEIAKENAGINEPYIRYDI